MKSGAFILNLVDKIEKVITDEENIIWSVADIAYSDFSDKYTRAIVLVQKYIHTFTNEDYDEERYEHMLISQRDSLAEKIKSLKQLFDQYAISSCIPPLSQTDERSLIASFSFKYAAVQAGLGWIGKSGVLVTKQFGPRVRLAAILVDYPLECGHPMTKSLCGDCYACVDACPYGAIKGINWNISIQREELLDYQLCNQKRSEYIDKMGRKHTCGYCILACPWG
jgi:epoxyqueuosine reductase